MVKIKRRSLVLVKSESTYGTDPTPTGSSNAILTMDCDIKETFEPVERNVQIASMSRKPSLGAMKYAEVTFKTEIVGSGSVGTAPRLGALFKACAFSETVSAGSSVIYTPNSSPITSCTVYVYLDGLRHIVNGALGTFKLSAEAGKQAMLEFTFKGLWTTPTDTALATPTFESTVDAPPIVKSASLTWNSNSNLIVRMLEIEMQNNIAMRPSVNAATALYGFHITDRKPKFSIDPEAESVATVDWRSDVLTNPRQLSMVIGATAGNICTLTMPKCNPTELEYSDREGTLVQNVKGEITANSSGGDDEMTIKFT